MMSFFIEELSPIQGTQSDITHAALFSDNNRQVKLHVYFSRERQKINFYRLPFIAQYVKVSSFVFGVSQ